MEKYQEILINSFIKQSSVITSGFGITSGEIPAFYELEGMTGLGPFGSDVSLHAEGTLDDVFFVFEGTDPTPYRTSGNYYIGPGTYPEGRIFHTEYTARHSYVSQDIGVIPAGTIFSIYIVDTVRGSSDFNGTVSITGLVDIVNFKTYGFQLSGKDYFKITKESASGIIVVGTYEYNTLPTITLEDGYTYKLYHIKYVQLGSGILINNQFIVPCINLSEDTKLSNYGLYLKMENGVLVDKGKSSYQITSDNISSSSSGNILFNNSRVTIPAPGVDFSVNNWWCEFKVKFLQFDRTMDFIQKGVPTSSTHDYRIMVVPRSTGLINIIFDSNNDYTTDILNKDFNYNINDFNTFLFERLSSNEHRLTINGVPYTWTSTVAIPHTLDRKTYFGTEDTDGIYYLNAEVEYISLYSGEIKETSDIYNQGIIVDSKLYKLKSSNYGVKFKNLILPGNVSELLTTRVL